MSLPPDAVDTLGSAPPSISDELDSRIGGLAAMAAAVRGRVDDAVLEPAETLTARAAERLRLSGEHTIVALAGATGSGKSSLFNALTDMELAGTGVRRPTTSWALACAWGPDGADSLLEWMGIPARHQVSRRGMLDSSPEHADLEGLVLLDLPDHDSTEVAHHLEMDRLVRYSDMLIWVLDPQKYADAAIHERYIRPMAAFSDVTLVVLNQIDKVPYEMREQALADVRRLIVDDGLTDVRVLGVSATRGDGIEELQRELAARIQSKYAAKARLVADIHAASEAISDVAGDAEEPVLSTAARAQLTDELAECAGVSQITSAIRSSTRRRARQRTGWPIARWLGRLRRGRSDRLAVPVVGSVQRANTELVVRQMVDEVARPLARPWRTAIRSAVGADGDVATALDQAIDETDLKGARIPVWCWLVFLIQWLLLLGAVTAGLYVLAREFEPRLNLSFDLPVFKDIEGYPFEAVVAVACLVAGLVLGVVSRLLTRVAARRKATRVSRALHDAVARVAERQVVEPVEGVLGEYGTYRRGLLAAQA